MSPFSSHVTTLRNRRNHFEMYFYCNSRRERGGELFSFQRKKKKQLSTFAIVFTLDCNNREIFLMKTKQTGMRFHVSIVGIRK